MTPGRLGTAQSMTGEVVTVIHEHRDVTPPGIEHARRGDTADVLASLAREAYAWAETLDSVRASLPALTPYRPADPAEIPSTVDVMGHTATRIGIESRSRCVGAVVEEMLRLADSEVIFVDPGDGARRHWPENLPSLLRDVVARGCRVRVLLGRSGHAALREVAECVEMAGGEIRVGPAPDHAILTIDSSAAILPAIAGGPSLTVVTEPPLVCTLRSLAEFVWDSGVPMEHRVAAGATPATDPDTANRQLHRRILQLLAGGAKDETIARLLGMSVRTCRRHIAEIMTKLDSVSRFQAGANAARFGLTAADAGTLRHH